MASLRRPGDCHRETIRFVTARIILTRRRDVDLRTATRRTELSCPSAHKWHPIATPSSRSGTDGRSETDPSRHPCLPYSRAAEFGSRMSWCVQVRVQGPRSRQRDRGAAAGSPSRAWRG
jgi:hypothetical protein